MFPNLSGLTRNLARRSTSRRQQKRLQEVRARKLRIETLEDRRVFARTVGLFVNKPAALDGYTLLAPSDSVDTYLVNNKGQQVHMWHSDRPPLSAYLQEDGSLIRLERAPNPDFPAGGGAGIIRQYDWDNNLMWEYTLSDNQSILHHDITVLPDGNIVAIVWDKISKADALQAGKRPNQIDNIDGEMVVWQEKLIEIKPNYNKGTGGKIVWEWNLIDHLVQDVFPGKDNYYGPNGVASHPELLDFNWIQPREPRGSRVLADWTHFNGIDYNPDLDQLSISSREFSEFLIIDHSTTTAEAASHKGGNSGKGGDILYRWGNPESHGAGNKNDRILFHQHNAAWIPKRLPGQGNITVFNNGSFRATSTPGAEDYSSIEEVQLPIKNEYQFYFNNKTNGSISNLIRFGKIEVGAPWSPITGDWNGNGRDTAGLYNRISNKFVLYKNVKTGTRGVITFKAPQGDNNWLPLAGDWNGDGVDTPGLYDPTAHTFYFYDYNQADKLVLANKFVTDAVPASWQPLIGDWNGDGKDTAGLYDAQSGTVYLRTRNVIQDNTLIQYKLSNVRAGWKPVAGDWNNDGKDTIGVYDARNHTFYLNNHTNGSSAGLVTFVTPDVPGSWLPIAGNWNGRGRDTVGLYNPFFQNGGQYDMSAQPKPVWHYEAKNPTSFNSPIISGAERLPNGNTLIDSGTTGRVFEVDRQGHTVWEYVNPIIAPTQGLTDARGRLRFDATVPPSGGLPTLLANYMFRALKYTKDFKGFEGRDLTPKGRLERYGQSAEQDQSELLDDFATSADEVFSVF